MPAIATTTSTMNAKSFGANSTWVPPMSYPRIEKAGGNARGVAPQTIPASAIKTV